MLRIHFPLSYRFLLVMFEAGSSIAASRCVTVILRSGDTVCECYFDFSGVGAELWGEPLQRYEKLWSSEIEGTIYDSLWRRHHILSTSPQSSKYNNVDIWYIDFWNWYIIINSGNSVLNNCSSFSKTVSGPHSIKEVFCFSCDHICWSFSLCVNTMLFVVIFASKICTGWGYIWSSLSSYHNG